MSTPYTTQHQPVVCTTVYRLFEDFDGSGRRHQRRRTFEYKPSGSNGRHLVRYAQKPTSRFRSKSSNSGAASAAFGLGRAAAVSVAAWSDTDLLDVKGHASVRLPCVLQMNVGHSKFGYRK